MKKAIVFCCLSSFAFANNDYIPLSEMSQSDKIKNNFVKNENLGSDTLNVNPRRIIVALKSKDSYLLKVDNVHFIPSSGDVEATCLADPFENGLSIEKGVLKIDLNYWYSKKQKG